MIADEYRAGGGIWILQEATHQKSEASYIDRDGSVKVGNWYRKVSGYYGPSGLIGSCVMYRRTKKVHGQYDTLFNLAV